MNKKIISKVGKRHRPEIDIMKNIKIEETREFDLDKHMEKPVKKKSLKPDVVNRDIEHNDQLVEKIENNEV